MRLILLMVAVVSWVAGQTLSEVGAAAAGSVTGGAAGKKVSDGINTILDKVDQKTGAAAASPAAAPAKPTTPLLEVSPGVVGTGLPSAPKPAPAPRAAAKVPVTRSPADSVPPPPPLPGENVKRIEPPAPPAPVVVHVAPPPPPPPPVKPEDLRTLTLGDAREDVLKLGEPASRITMFEDGHLLEIYRYMSGDTTFGVVRLTNGAVSQVDVR